MKYTLYLFEKCKKDRLELQIEYMHGDADAYTTESFFFEGLNFDSVKNTIERLSLINSRLKDKYNYSAKFLFTKEERELLGLGEKDSDDIVFEEWPRDVTDLSGDQRATIDKYTLYYWDSDGNKNNIKFETELVPGVYIR